jgi:hypothetical protein
LDNNKLVLNQEVQVTAKRFVFLVSQVGEQGLAREGVPTLDGVRMIAQVTEVGLGYWQRQSACRKKVL